MWTLKVLITGVVFLLPHPGQNSQALWVFMLNPGALDNHAPHSATIKVNPKFLAPGSRLPDTSGASLAEFRLANEHLQLRPATGDDDILTELAFATGTRQGNKPFGNNSVTMQQQREDFDWVHSLAQLVADVPAHTETAKQLRGDLTYAHFDDPVVFARLVLPGGYVRSHALWGEEGDALNTEINDIGGYCFNKPGNNLCPSQQAVAVSEWASVDISIVGTVELLSRRLNDGATDREPIRLSAPDGEVVTVVLNSAAVGHAMASDLDAFYALLNDRNQLAYFPRAVMNVGPDTGGACSPRKP